MIRRFLSNHVYIDKSYLLSTLKTRWNSLVYYHSDSIEGNTMPEEPIFNEQRLSSQEATGILRTHEASIDMESHCPVKYYEMNYLGANNPPGISREIPFQLNYVKHCFSFEEDRQAQARIHSLTSNMYLFGVFDGHGGPWCSDVVGQRLFEYIAVTLHAPDDLQRIMQEAKRILSHPPAHIHSHPSEKTSMNPLMALLLQSFHYPYKDTRNSRIKELHQLNLLKHIEDAYTNIDHDHTKIIEALESAFSKLDRDICAEAIPIDSQSVDEELLQICTAGSCACVALIKDDDLYIANCGDARAILGTIDEQGNQGVINLSHDHNIRNQSEVKRVLAEHPPNESHSVIRSERLLGLLMPFRAFGDVRFKWPANHLREYLQPYYKKGDAIPQFYLTPPYLTVKPEITKHKLSKKDKFLLLATDGVWDLLSPEKVVESIFNHQKGIQSFDRFVLHKSGSTTTLKLKEINQLLLARQQAIQNQPIDQNSATHLIRQALAFTSKGQFDSKLLSDVLTIPNPRSIRDDITITVVYFDQDFLDQIPRK